MFVSSILKCSRVNPDRINKINELLLTKCQQKNFIYIDNNNITEQHLWKDGLHLKEDGKNGKLGIICSISIIFYTRSDIVKVL